MCDARELPAACPLWRPVHASGARATAVCVSGVLEPVARARPSSPASGALVPRPCARLVALLPLLCACLLSIWCRVVSLVGMPWSVIFGLVYLIGHLDYLVDCVW